MKKFLPYILILTVILQIFAPFTIGNGVNSNLEIQINKAEAGVVPDSGFNEWNTLDGFKNAFNSSELKINATTVHPETSTAYVDIYIKINTGIEEYQDPSSVWQRTDIGSFMTPSVFKDKDFIVHFKETETGKTGYYNLMSNMFPYPYSNMRDDAEMLVFIKKDLQIGTAASPLIPVNGLSVLSPGKEYTATLYYQAIAGDITISFASNNEGEDPLSENDPDYFPIKSVVFTTATVEQGYTGQIGSGETEIGAGKNASIMPGCSILPLDPSGSVMGCVAQGFYYVLFVPTSYIFALAGTFFDFTFHYSIQDSSYRSPFVVEGWGLIRDFCNMFFIFILLYIAFGTILNLNSVKTKEMIINVVIIGLLINFSLFATQVIVDASNILARVFYTSDAIKITQGDNAKNGVTNATPGLKVGPNGEIPLSAAIVNKVNPQNLIINGTSSLGITDKGGQSTDKEGEANLSIASFILITILAAAVNIVGIIVFMSVGLIFVGRVIGLWIAMILSPFVFFSYTVPSLQDMEMVGWKKWWPETIKLAFLAPVFIFFMYIIIAFLETGLSLIKSNKGTDGLTFVISIVVPFIFIMVLLMKAKDIAKKMSGTMGSMITDGMKKYGGMALGVAGGVALGGASMAMRGTLGRAGSSVANKKWLANAEAKGGFGGWVAKQTRSAGSAVGKGSMDLRGIKIAGKGLSDTGLKNIGKAKEGGFTKYKADQIENRKKRAEELKNITSSDEKNKILDYEAKINEEKQKIENSPEKQKVNIKNEKLNAIKADPKIERDVETAEGELKKIERELQDLKDKGQSNTLAADMKRAERDYKINQISNIKKPIKDAEKELKDAEYELYNISTELRDAEKELMKHKNDLANTQNRVLKNYAQSIQSSWGNTINRIVSFGQETKAANEQAAREILANLPQERK